ncbi:MAG: proton-conducting transporter transmembrane domain-containing protein [Mycobacteriales bacterium]
MTVTVLLALAAGMWLTAAVVAVGGVRPAGLRLTAMLSGVGGAAALGGGATLLLARHALVGSAGGSTTVGTLTFRATPLAAVFVALLGLIALAIACYQPRYHSPGAGSAVYLAAYNLALLSALALLVAGSVTVFLVAWESMALLCYFLVLRNQRRDEVAAGGFWFLALSEAGFVLIVAAFVLLATRTGSLDLATIAARAPHLGLGTRSAAYVLALIGFGFKAGLVPLHVWLPEAHPVAPADGSAFLSGLVVKLGVYGILLFGFDLLGRGPAWWGLLTMGLGALSALIGILYALTERDLKRFLAFSTIENVGIILTAAGAAMTFGSYGQRDLAAFLLLGALYHAANHGSYKTLLFLDAGVVEHASGTRDMDRLGGLIRRLPRTAVTGLVGTLGIAALPPLNGFVSEWLIFQGLFQGFRIPSHLVGTLILVAAAVLGLTGGLAVAAFVRGFGIPFLGMARTRGAAQASERGQPVVGPALLAAGCVALGVGAPAVLVALASAVRATTGVHLLPKLVIAHLTVIPAHTNFSAFSPTYLAVFLLAALSVPGLVYLAGRPRGSSRRAPVWDGGITAFEPRMQYSAMTFAAPERVTFATLYRPEVSVRRASDDPAGRSGPVHYESEVTPVFLRYLYRPVILAVEWLADLVRPIQSGDVNLYLLYIFVVLLVAYLLGAL